MPLSTPAIDASITKMFSGFMSRWMIPRSCAAASAVAHLPRDLRRHVRAGPRSPRALALEELADEIRGAVRVVQVHVEHVDDVRVLDGARGLRLAEKASRHLRVARGSAEGTSRRSATPSGEGDALVDAPHAAFADDTRDAVRVAEELAEHRVRRASPERIDEASRRAGRRESAG